MNNTKTHLCPHHSIDTGWYFPLCLGRNWTTNGNITINHQSGDRRRIAIHAELHNAIFNCFSAFTGAMIKCLLGWRHQAVWRCRKTKFDVSVQKHTLPQTTALINLHKSVLTNSPVFHISHDWTVERTAPFRGFPITWAVSIQTVVILPTRYVDNWLFSYFPQQPTTQMILSLTRTLSESRLRAQKTYTRVCRAWFSLPFNATLVYKLQFKSYWKRLSLLLLNTMQTFHVMKLWSAFKTIDLALFQLLFSSDS